MSWHDRVFDDDKGMPWQPQWDAWQRSASLSDWPEWDEGLWSEVDGMALETAGPEFAMAWWEEWLGFSGLYFRDFYAPRARFVSDR